MARVSAVAAAPTAVDAKRVEYKEATLGFG